MARAAGAKNVYFASAAPPIRYPNVYGIDMAVKSELIAYGRTDKEIEQEIGADWLIYQNLDDMIKAATPSDEDKTPRQFDCSVFNGEYITGDINDLYFQKLQDTRGDKLKENPSNNSNSVDLYGNT